jgi:hypothetical protein
MELTGNLVRRISRGRDRQGNVRIEAMTPAALYTTTATVPVLLTANMNDAIGSAVLGENGAFTALVHTAPAGTRYAIPLGTVERYSSAGNITRFRLAAIQLAETTVDEEATPL